MRYIDLDFVFYFHFTTLKNYVNSLYKSEKHSLKKIRNTANYFQSFPPLFA